MGSQAMVELLVGGRPDLDVNIVEANSCSALMIACMHGYIQVMLLSAIDLDVNFVEANSCSALMIACMHGYIQVMLLSATGLDVSLLTDPDPEYRNSKI